MFPVINVDELENKEKMSENPVVFRAEQKQVYKCGRIVCCGKHKNGQCACQRKGRERD